MKTSVWWLSFAFSMVCLAVVCDACQTPQATRPDAPAKANLGAKRTLGFFKPVRRTNYLRAPVNSQREGEYSKGSYDSVQNYIFFNVEDETTHSLFPTDDHWIAETRELPEKDEEGSRQPTLTKWFVYYVIKVDTDGDRQLTHKDHRTLAVSDAGGNGYTEIIRDLEEGYGQTFRETDTLFVFYRSQSTRYVAKIDLANRKAVSTRELPLNLDDLQ